MSERTIKIYIFFRCWNIPNASPPCMKLETFLRMSKINYDIQFLATPLSAPNGKVPYVEMDGKTISDSGVIIRQLSKNKEIAYLAKDDSGAGTLISRLLENHLYWVMVYSRFLDPSGIPNWKDEFRKLASFKTKPSFVCNIIFKVLQKQVTKELFQMGLGRLKQDDICCGYRRYSVIITYFRFKT